MFFCGFCDNSKNTLQDTSGAAFEALTILNEFVLQE